jgi:hypothetical protein
VLEASGVGQGDDLSSQAEALLFNLLNNFSPGRLYVIAERHGAPAYAESLPELFFGSIT